MAHEAHPNRAPHQQAVQDAQTTHPWDLFRRAPGFICVLRGPNHVFEFANDCYLRLVGGREVIGKPLREALPEIAAQPFPDILDRVYQTGEPYTAFETPVELRCAPGAPSQRRILNFVYQPFQDAQGRTTGVFVEGFDVTEFKRAKMATVRLASIVKSCDDAIISKDLQGHVISWNPSAERLFGYTAQEAIGRTISELIIPANRQDEEADILRRLARDEATDHYETVRHRKDGSTLDVSVTISPLREDGKIVGGLKIARDISQRKRSERRRDLLIHELNHRVKNTLVTVQSLARNSLRTGDREATGFTAFEDRLLALSAAHNVLTLEDWAFAEVQKIVMGAIKPYLAPDPAARFEVEGDPLRLQPHAGLALAMALHELATNAVKHGALSSQRGRVRIRWWQTRDGECGRALFRLGWTETGGPRVAPPTWRGFGSRLIEEGLAQDLDGLVDLRFEPSGLVCAISAPLDGIVAGDEGPAISAENAVVQKN